MKSSRRQIVIVALALLALGPERAPAAPYEVQACREEVRESLPTTDWSTVGPSRDFGAETNCTSRPITAQPIGFGPTWPGGEGGLSFSVPKPLAIVGVKYRQLIHTSTSKYPPGQWWWDFESRQTTVDGKIYPTGQCPGEFVDGCSEAYGLISHTPINRLTALHWMLKCNRRSVQACPHDVDVDISIYDGLFRIDDPESPTITGRPEGALFAGGTNLSGDQTVAFEAADLGSGIYRAAVEVDGAVLGETRLSQDTATCRLPFRTVQPCPLRTVNSVVVDTTRLADGQHDAYLKVYDASDHNVAVHGPVSFTTNNSTITSYCGSEDKARFQLGVPRRPLPFGKAWRFRARITDAAGWEAVLLDGKRMVSSLGAAVVSASGQLQIKVPRGPNRFVRLAIRPAGSRGKHVCSRSKLVRVRPKLTLSLNSPETTNGSSVTIRGRLFGDGASRKAIVIQARALGSRRWATVRVLRSKRTGRYRMRYRFRSSSPGTVYVFRSQARGERGYPYSTGTSSHRRLRIVRG